MPTYIEPIMPILDKLIQLNNNHLLDQVIDSLYMLIQLPEMVIHLEYIFQFIHGCLEKKNDPDTIAYSHEIYQRAVMFFGKAITFNLPHINKQLVDEWISLLPIDEYPEENLTSLFIILRDTQFIEINEQTIQQTLQILLYSLGCNQAKYISTSTKELITEHLKFWFQQFNHIIDPLWNQISPEEKSLLDSLLE